jgi:hypothetical protein
VQETRGELLRRRRVGAGDKRRAILEKKDGCRRQEKSYCGEEGWVQKTKRRYIMEKEVVCRRQEEIYCEAGGRVKETKRGDMMEKVVGCRIPGGDLLWGRKKGAGDKEERYDGRGGGKQRGQLSWRRRMLAKDKGKILMEKEKRYRRQRGETLWIWRMLAGEKEEIVLRRGGDAGDKKGSIIKKVGARVQDISCLTK